ncbi:hypothetical protein AMEX_G26953, partial [Astyanax mexicanus]
STLCNELVFLNVADLPQPELSVSPAVITQRDLVKLDCRAPDNEEHQCYYYPEGQERKAKLSPFCDLSLTGSELIEWTGRRSDSPEPVYVICYYSNKAKGDTKRSPHSPSAAVTILDQKPTISVQYDFQGDEFIAVCEIQLSRSVIAEFSCQLYTGDLQFLKGESQKSGFEKLNCIFTASKNDLFSRLHLARSREVSCDYSLKSDPSTRSPRSDKFDISDLPQPFLSVSPAVITQNESVELHCGADNREYQCIFYPKGQDTRTKLSSSCQLSLTGSELMWWTRRSSGSPEPVNMICFYSKKATAGSRPSDHSAPVAVLILGKICVSIVALCYCVIYYCPQSPRSEQSIINMEFR